MAAEGNGFEGVLLYYDHLMEHPRRENPGADAGRWEPLTILMENLKSKKLIILENQFSKSQKGNHKMKKINLAQASQFTSPNPVTVVCTEKPDGSTNLATVSWWTYLSYNPNMIAYAMAKTSYSGEMVRSNRKVILTIPGVEIADAVLGCGTTTGRNTDKTAEFGIELTGVEGSSVQIPVHSCLAIVCSLKEYHEVGDHYLYICDVEQVYGNEEEEALFAWNGYAELRPVK